MHDTQACRACLNTDSRLERIPDSWYRLFEYLTGIQISKSDGYPNYFCIECKSHMNKAVAFRKKSRRAFFVLKEIMSVKNEVTVPDILTVDRSKVNLKSGFGLWKPEKQHIYLIYSGEGQDPEDKLKWDIVTRNAVISIGEADTTIQDANEFGPNAVDLVNDDDIQRDDVADDHEDESQPPPSDIDMEDVFKGLKEPESEESDVEEQVDETVKKETKKAEQKINVGEERTMAKALTLFSIDLLTYEEQVEAYVLQKERPDYKFAVCKCDACGVAMSDYDQLLRHHREHIATKDSAHICGICRNRFADENKLKFHTSEMHRYKYTCKVCNDVFYQLKEVIKHRYNHVEKRAKPAGDLQAELLDNFLLIPINEDDMKETFMKLSCSGRYTCDECSMSFAVRSSLALHLAQHRKTYGKPCPICGINYRHEAMINHMETCHEYIYHCKLCSYEAQNRLLAEHHLKRKHRDIWKLHVCQYCGWKTRSDYSLQSHCQCKHWAQMYKCHCAACGRGFADLGALYAHQFREYDVLYFPKVAVRGARNACSLCNVQFLSEKAYHNHLVKANHEEAEALPWKCLPCKKLFESEEQHKEHSACCRFKTINFPSPCRLCGETVNSRRDFFKHCKIHHPNYTSSLFDCKRRLCENCGNTYKHKCICQMPEKQDKRRKYDVDKYKCSLCDIVFKKALQIVNHVLIAHAKEPYSCNICSQTFKLRYTCKDHILKVHAPVKPYGCPICHTEFAHLDFVKKHAKKIHDVKIHLESKKKKKRKFYLYPNMKVDLSLVDSRIVNELKISVADYTDQLFEVIDDYEDYVILNKRSEIKKDDVEL